MDAIISYYKSLGLDFWTLLEASGITLTGLLVLGLLGKFIFGKKSNLTYALSSVIGIIMMCTVIIGIRCLLPQYARFMAPMPFVTIGADSIGLFHFQSAHYTAICTEVLSMIILSFLSNTVDRWMPKPKNFFGWLFFRILTVVIALVLHLVASALILQYVPEGLVTYAPVVLLAILILMLLTGALKLLVGVLLSTVNPVIGALYTFFFASIVGKTITRAVLTTGLLALLITVLQQIGLGEILITPSALIVYIPFLVLLIPTWYLTNRHL